MAISASRLPRFSFLVLKTVVYSISGKASRSSPRQGRRTALPSPVGAVMVTRPRRLSRTFARSALIVAMPLSISASLSINRRPATVRVSFPGPRLNRLVAKCRSSSRIFRLTVGGLSRSICAAPLTLEDFATARKYRNRSHFGPRPVSSAPVVSVPFMPPSR